MKKITVGIIAEYNPFHNGHALQIRKIRKQFPNCNIVVVMSGFFLQRGQAALFDKWSRAELAISNGANLVLELPFNFSCRSAETFAFGGVFLLNELHSVDYLAFGSETADLKLLQNIALQFSAPDFSARLRLLMKTGLSYPKALQQLLTNPSTATIIAQPNNILGIEYLKALLNLKSSIKPFLIKREFSHYKDLTINSSIASATAIREHLKTTGLDSTLKTTLPNSSFLAIEKLNTAQKIVFLEKTISPLLLYKLRNVSSEYIKKHSDVSEGLENSILKHAQNCNTYQSLLSKLTNKRYPQSRIARILIQILIGLEKTSNPTYFRPLAFDKTGADILATSKNIASLPIITKLGKSLSAVPQHLHYCPNLINDIVATNTYQLLYEASNGQHNLDYLASPKYVCKNLQK